MRAINSLHKKRAKATVTIGGNRKPKNGSVFRKIRNVVTMKIKKSERENGSKIGNVVTMADFWSRFSVSDFRSL